MNDSSHETEDLIQARRGEGGKPDTCTYHHARINSQHLVALPIAAAFLLLIRKSTSIATELHIAQVQHHFQRAYLQKQLIPYFHE